MTSDDVDLRAVLETAKRDWERTFDAIHDGILILDPAGTVVRVNRAVKERLDRPYREIVGRTLSEVLGNRGAQAVRDAIEGRGAGRGGVAIPDIEGIFEVDAYPRGGEGAEAGGHVVVLADVTEKERLREQLLHSEKLSALGEIISGIAHELNNPLTAVLGYAQILDLRAGGQFGRELTHLREESSRASRIVRNLLTFARQGENRRLPDDLNDVIRKTVALREYDLRVRNIDVVLRLDPSLPPFAMDRSQVQQVVLNLLNNAEYAIRTVRDSGRIEVSTIRSGDRARLEVHDDGPGIPPAVQARIFHPFFTTKPVGRGTGLGLSICYGILRDHGGEIRLDPDCDIGARFVAEFPLGPEAARPSKEKVAKNGGSPGGRTGRRLLIVDDEAAIRLLGAEFLAALGYEVRESADGAAALKRMESEVFDAVLCDLRMPGVDGAELYRRACELDPAYRDRFVFMTGDDARREAEALHAPVLEKPFDLDEMTRVIRQTLHGA